MRHLHRTDVRVRIETAQAIYCAPVVVAADGAKSLVRQRLVPDADPSHISRLMEVLTPEPQSHLLPEFWEHMAVFDFTPVVAGCRATCGTFPRSKRGSR